MTDNQHRILFVEDDLSLASIYIMKLESEGLEVLHCPDGEEALQKFREFNPDLIILDLMMPHVNGFEVLDSLRNMPNISKPKIVVLSALGETENKEKAIQLGADEFLVKSHVLLDDVFATIQRLLEAPAEPATDQSNQPPSNFS